MGMLSMNIHFKDIRNLDDFKCAFFRVWVVQQLLHRGSQANSPSTLPSSGLPVSHNHGHMLNDVVPSPYKEPLVQNHFFGDSSHACPTCCRAYLWRLRLLSLPLLLLLLPPLRRPRPPRSKCRADLPLGIKVTITEAWTMDRTSASNSLKLQYCERIIPVGTECRFHPSSNNELMHFVYVIRSCLIGACYHDKQLQYDIVACTIDACHAWICVKNT